MFIVIPNALQYFSSHLFTFYLQYLAKRQFQRPKSLFTTLFASVASNGQPYRRITGMAVPFQYSIGNNELSPPSSSIHYKPAYVSVSLHEGSVEADDPKLKNVHQTEILVELKQSIQLVCQLIFFISFLLFIIFFNVRILLVTSLIISVSSVCVQCHSELLLDASSMIPFFYSLLTLQFSVDRYMTGELHSFS